MRIGTFLKNKIDFIILNFIVAILNISMLYIVNSSSFFVLFVPVLYLFGCFFVLFIEYFRKNSYYFDLQKTIDELDQKCLLSEIIEKPNFIEGQILYDILKISDKDMNDKIAEHRISSAEYREYIELWVHEIKTPIAGALLIGENSGNAALTDTLQRIDRYVEQALFYSRSNTVEKDFLIKKVVLTEPINTILRKNAKFIIENKISMNIKDIENIVFTDTKWLEFILWQILDNSIKYKSTEIKIYSEQNPNSVSLYICDNGIGIPKQDVNRVFEKGFTGENGRNHAKSTGLGLYLCKKLCLKLGLNISLKSEQNVGTIIEIVLPKSEMYTDF